MFPGRELVVIRRVVARKKLGRGEKNDGRCSGQS